MSKPFNKIFGTSLCPKDLSIEEYHLAVKSWNACKKEVLRLIYHDDCYIDRKYIAVPNHIVDKIKDL